MRDFWIGLGSYRLPIVVSVMAHLLLVVFVAWGWEAAEPPRSQVKPRYVEATLVTIDPKSKKPQAQPKPNKVVDVAAKRREQERLQKAAAEKKRLAKEKAERERLRKLAEEKKRKDAEKKKLQAEKDRQERERQERERLAREQQLQREAAMAQALADEEELIQAQQAEATAQSYVALIAQQIEQNWSRPPSARRGMKCELRLQLVPTGEVVNVTVVRSSGNDAFDRSAELAVKRVGRFRGLQDVPTYIFDQYFRQLTLVFDPQDLRL